MSASTAQQLAAIAARGNVLVAAGAGTGKTSTVTARCLDLIVREQCSIEHILLVTFTEAAAAEMRERIRTALRDQVAAAAADTPGAHWLAEQLALLDTAPISTLHSFCLDLVRRNFHRLGLDPQFTVLDEQQTKPLIHSVLDTILERHFSQTTEQSQTVAALIRTYGGGRDEAVRQWVGEIHRHAQTLADPDHWFADQISLFSQPEAGAWRALFVEAVLDWRRHWRDSIEELAGQSANLAACARALESLPDDAGFAQATAALAQVLAADAAKWEHGTKTRLRTPIASFFSAAAFLHELTRDEGAPLTEDWAWSRGPMLALLHVAREFSDEFAKAKRELGGIDFADQEQFALRLLLHNGQPTAIAETCRERFRFVFVDECQDINAAQDAILRAVSREGADANRFLVGDVKQSIYRFRLANPRIFQDYQKRWSQGEPVVATPDPEAHELQLDFFGQPMPPSRRVGKKARSSAPAVAPVPTLSAHVLSLSENFRSREALLQFVNPLFRALMRPELGGLTYDAEAALHFGSRDQRTALSLAARRDRPPELDASSWPTAEEVNPRIELHVLTKDTDSGGEETNEGDGGRSDLPDLKATEREALLVARRLKELHKARHRVWSRKESCFVEVKYSDMVVLMRSTTGRAEVFARAFHREGIPLHAGRAGFLQAQEVTDVLNLLRLLDNPLQDLPLLAVLRSPFVGLSAEELVTVRLAERRELLWTALAKVASSESPQTCAGKARDFLAQFQRWRELIRHSSLTQCIESALTETHYEALLLAGERGPERVANLRQLVALARRFDPFQREGLFRFLQFIVEQEEVEARHEPAELFHENAVRLMTIHASKGLEFPVVVVTGLGNRFNLRDLSNDILLHEDLGLCPKVLPPESRTKYPSLVHWLAGQREKRALLGEELRLLYVALTRARDTLILTGAASRRDEITRWEEAAAINNHSLVKAGCFLDWLRLWFTNEVKPLEWLSEQDGANELLRWRFYGVNDALFQAVENPSPPERMAIRPPTTLELELIRQRITNGYPHAAATVEPAKSSVTTLRRRAADEADAEARPLFQSAYSSRSAPKLGKLSRTEIGTAHHTFLQFVALNQTASEAGLQAEATRLRADGLLTDQEVAALDFQALNAFWQSAIGVELRRLPGPAINREVPFTARFDVPELTRLIGETNRRALDDFVVVQGVVDLAVVLPEEIWVLDFKTDHFESEALTAKVKEYTPQLQIYALALGRIYRRPVTRCWLHFLSVQRTEPVELV